jgi:hypothetical protein
MELIEDYWTGNINDVIESLNRSIAQYIRHNNKVKIGITCNPNRRINEHSLSKENWDKMIVKYKTTSVNYINEIEKILIDNHWDYIANEVAGGGGPNGNSPYFLYVLLK